MAVPIPDLNLTGGAATAKNGDQFVDSFSEFGGLDYSKGVSPWLIALGIVAAVFVMVKS